MFSNGTEHDEFMVLNCDSCPRYVHYEEATPERPVCSIEEKIAVCAFLSGEEAKEVFPYEWLDENGKMSRYVCRKKEGKDAKNKGNIPKIEIPQQELKSNFSISDIIKKK